MMNDGLYYYSERSVDHNEGHMPTMLVEEVCPLDAGLHNNQYQICLVCLPIIA